MINNEILEKARKDIEEKFNIKFMKINSGEAIGELEILEQYINSWGIPYGGILFNLADVTAGAAYLSAGGNGITVSGHVDYMRSSKNAEKLICNAKVSKYGKKLCFVDAYIKNDKEINLCKFSFIFANL